MVTFFGSPPPTSPISCVVIDIEQHSAPTLVHAFIACRSLVRSHSVRPMPDDRHVMLLPLVGKLG
jgi:hypothetical protein